MRSTRPTSGRSRSPRTGADPQRHDRPLAARHGGAQSSSSQFHHVINITPTVSRIATPARRWWVTSFQRPIEGVEHGILVRRGELKLTRRKTPVFRDVLQPRHCPARGWTTVTRPFDALDRRSPAARRSTRISRSSPDQPQVEQARRSRRRAAGELADYKLWLKEAREYDVLPLDDQRIERFDAQLSGRPDYVEAKLGRCSSPASNSSARTASSTSRDGRRWIKLQGIVVARCRRRGRDPRPGRRLRRLEPLCERWHPTYYYDLLGLERFKVADTSDPARTPPVRIEFTPMTAAAAKAAQSRCTLTAQDAGEGRIEQPCGSMSPADGPPTSDKHRVPGERRFMTARAASSPARRLRSRSTSARTRTTPTTSDHAGGRHTHHDSTAVGRKPEAAGSSRFFCCYLARRDSRLLGSYVGLLGSVPWRH